MQRQKDIQGTPTPAMGVVVGPASVAVVVTPASVVVAPASGMVIVMVSVGAARRVTHVPP